MRSNLRLYVWIPAGVTAMRVVASCLDFTPITTLGTAGASDGAAGPDGASTMQTACLSCADQADDAGGCAGEFNQCNALALCEATVGCVVGQCFKAGVNVTQCLAACEADGGITSSQGAPNAAFAAFLSCMSTRCLGACFR
jgi:hypothetical protein